MNRLELAWSTYEFYTLEITEHELAHVQLIKEINQTFPKLTLSERRSIKSKYTQQHGALCTLYKKHIDSISDLIELHKSLVDIPPERDVSLDSLQSLKNVTYTLLEEINVYKKEIDELFS